MKQISFCAFTYKVFNLKYNRKIFQNNKVKKQRFLFPSDNDWKWWQTRTRARFSAQKIYNFFNGWYPELQTCSYTETFGFFDNKGIPSSLKIINTKYVLNIQCISQWRYNYQKKKHRGDAEHCRYQIHFPQSNKLILIESQKVLELIDCRILSVCKNNNCLC